MKISVIIPTYNEDATLERCIRAVYDKNPKLELEVIVVDDGSTDSTESLVRSIQRERLKYIKHSVNRGKGAAIRTGLDAVTGDIVLIQDADLEYDPTDYPVLLGPLLDNRADVVYGSRFLGGPHRVLLFWHYLANLFFTFLTNILYNVNLTDMGVGYKVFRKEILRSFPLRSDRFGFEPEVTAKVCKRDYRLYEVPISYTGRTYAEGKKITWRDGLVYCWCILRYRICD